MSYQVLARKWRPNQFSELVGQEHVVRAIVSALDNQRLHHAYLFTGTRGVGKTTIARIFAKSLNCETGTSSTPCGKCGTCLEIEQGRYVDLLEIDAASRTKVEDTRELLDNVQYKPTRGEYKVYLIDEVHMLSKHSFNALLKTLEEPPPHVKFLLATTDPQKLPVTILSRCLQFSLKALSKEQIFNQLSMILEQESIESEKNAVNELARAAQGSMRDALSLTDQAIAQGNGKVEAVTVTEMLGLLDRSQILKLLHHTLSKDKAKLFQLVDDIALQAPDYETVLNELMSLLHQVALTQFVPEACKLETHSAKAIYHLASNFPPEQVQLLYQIALEGKKELPHSADGRISLEMTLLRMLAFVPKSISMEEGRAQLIQEPPSNHVHLIQNESTNTAIVEDTTEEQIEHSLNEEQIDILQQAETMRAAIAPTSPEPETSDIVLPSETNIVESNLVPEPRPSSVAPTTIEEFAEPLQSVSMTMPTSVEDHPPSENALPIDENLPVETVVPTENVPPVPIEPAPAQYATTQDLLALRQQLKGESPSDGGEPPKKPEAFSEADNLIQFDSVAPNIDDGSFTNDGDSRGPAEEPESEQTIDIPTAVIEPVEVVQSAHPVDNVQNSLTESDHQQNLYEETIISGDSNDDNIDFEVPLFLENGEKVLSASQVDTWSQLIDEMAITGLTKQLAIHCMYRKVEHQVTLSLHKDQEHLLNDAISGQLQTELSRVLQQPIELDIQVQEVTDTPFAVQKEIDRARLQHAKSLIYSDENVLNIIDSFDANIIENSIEPRP